MVWEILAWAILAIWAVLIILFLLPIHPPGLVKEVKRAQGWWVGLLLQALGYAAIFVWARSFGSPISHRHMPDLLEIALAASAVVIAVSSAWLVVDAVRALGKQWSLAARVISGHQLVTSGPFHVVRHPIYTGMLGMLIATTIAFSTWLGLLVSLALYLFGTSMRIRKEERLLRETFGADYEAYASEVPALVPGLF